MCGINLAASLAMVSWRIGCSGYHYAEWKGLFYPQDIAKKNWFEFYCQHFNTIELNTTFYRFPRIENLRGWYSRSPDHFSFSVKAPRAITHFKRLKDVQKYLVDFYTATREGLREKLGAILFQFPSDFKYDEHNLERLVKLLDASFNNVVEFRNRSWWNASVNQLLQEHNIVFSGMSHPALPDQVVKTAGNVYYRFHGVPHLYISSYGQQQLETIIQAIQQQEDIREAFVYFNNTAEGAAVGNAKQFQEMCELVH